AVDETVTVHAPAQPEVAEQLRGAGLDHAGPLPGLDVGAVPALQDHRVDAGPTQQVAEQQPGRAAADDGDLGTLAGHGVPRGGRSRTTYPTGNSRKSVRAATAPHSPRGSHSADAIAITPTSTRYQTP